MTVALYLHIPFCHARCGYCDFTTFTGKESQIDRYVDALCREMDFYPDPRTISTIFFGGGTPSLLEPQHIDKILAAARRHFSMDPQAEVTLEANPESISRENLVGWKSFGINRLSIGLQAMDDGLLKSMERLHTVKDFLNAYKLSRDVGYDNVSVDLIYGFPGQTLLCWQDTFQKTVALAPDHLSLYALKVEDHTPFRAQGVSVDDDLQAEMYEWAREALSAQGYEQYEISNFAKPGKACRHNLVYWRQEDYLGLGVGAVGCVGALRWTNTKTLQDYFRHVDSGTRPILSTETLDEPTRKFERLMLGLRLRQGFQWEETNPLWIEARRKLQVQRLLEEITPGQWRIPDHAVGLTNQILMPFVGLVR